MTIRGKPLGIKPIEINKHLFIDLPIKQELTPHSMRAYSVVDTF
jgi:hypothetical protein